MSAFDNATLMITGGTGSFGSTVLKHFLDSDLKEIRILPSNSHSAILTSSLTYSFGRYHPMPRTKGSKNRITASTDFDAQIRKLQKDKALGDIRGVSYIYGMFYRFGLIDVPEKVKEKMNKCGCVAKS